MRGPTVGVGAFVFGAIDDQKNREKFIVGKRMGSLGAGTFALPGGHLEPGESFEVCAAREVYEETGLHVDENSLCVINVVESVIYPELNANETGHKETQGAHYVTVAVACRVGKGQGAPIITEPEKCEGWQYWSWEQMKHVYSRSHKDPAAAMRLFKPLEVIIEQRAEIAFDPLIMMEHTLEGRRRLKGRKEVGGTESGSFT